jgi:hypothetical protein
MESQYSCKLDKLGVKLSNKRRKCKLHKEYTETWVKFPAGIFCTKDAAIEWARNKAKEKKRKDYNEVTKKLKKVAKVKDITHQHELTQRAFNKLRVLQELKWFSDRGLEPTCISCQKPIGNDIWCNGHFISRGASSFLRYHPSNSFIQHNRSCNMAKSGDIEGYKIGLVKRFGSRDGNKIIEFCQNAERLRKWTGEELQVMRKDFNRLIREIQNNS